MMAMTTGTRQHQDKRHRLQFNMMKNGAMQHQVKGTIKHGYKGYKTRSTPIR